MSRPTPPADDANASQTEPLNAETHAASGRSRPGRATGPKTVAGKAKSRANAVKHGLRCQVVEPPADREAIAERVAAWTEALQPADPVAAWLVARAAAQSVRLDRCRERECLALEANVAGAERDWLRRRRAWARRLGHQLGSDPERLHARLTRSALGCDWLIARLDDLARDLAIPGGYWSTEEFVRALTLLGLEARRCGPDHPAVAPLWRLTLTAQSRPDPAAVDALLGTDTRALDEPARRVEQRAQLGDREPARQALLAFVRTEQEQLTALRAALWDTHDAPALEAACAHARTFDPSPEAAHARRYEASHALDLHRTLTALHRHRLASDVPAAAPSPLVPTPDAAAPNELQDRETRDATSEPSRTSEPPPATPPASPPHPSDVSPASAERPQAISGASSPRLDGGQEANEGRATPRPEPGTSLAARES